MTLVPKHIRDRMSPEDRAKYEAMEIKASEGNLRGRERQEQKILNSWLSLQREEGKLYSINPRSDKASTIRCGHPDYTIFLPNGRVLLMEMKVEGGVLSPEQRECIVELSSLGFTVEVPHSASHAISLIVSIHTAPP